MVRWFPIRTVWKRSPSFLRVALATLPVLLVTVYLYLESRKSERSLLEAETSRNADNAYHQFQDFVGTRIGALNDVGNFVLATAGTAGRQNFASFVKRLLAEMRDIESVSWIDPEGHVLQTVDSTYAHTPFTPVINPAVTETLGYAALAHGPAATASFNLLAPGQQGMVVAVPVFRDGHLEGTVTGTIRVTQAIHTLYGQDVLDFWNVELYDRSGRNVFRSLVWPLGYASPAPPALVVTRHIPVADRAWKLRLWPTPLMEATLRTAAPQRISDHRAALYSDPCHRQLPARATAGPPRPVPAGK